MDSTLFPTAAAPTKSILIWPGGKTRLASWIAPQMPTTFADYHEPFFGGGAIFFHTTPRHLQKAHISDENRELMNFWQAVKTQPHDTYHAVMAHKQNTSLDYWLEQREMHNTYDLPETPRSSRLERAARFCYLIRGAFNGTYSRNQKRLCNSTPGTMCQPENKQKFLDRTGIYHGMHIPPLSRWLACHKALQHTHIAHQDYNNSQPKPGDLVYLDPPYYQSRQDYMAHKFNAAHQKELHKKACEWRDNGVHVMASNNGSDFIRNLWNGWHATQRDINYTLAAVSKPQKTEMLLLQ